MRRLAAALALLAVASWQLRRAEACGCFAPPNVANTVVQAGERILFSVDQGTVTAVIQIQYQGSADQFGWLVPLPSVPTLQLGTDEVFTSLESTTQPVYQVSTVAQRCMNPPGQYGSSGSGGSYSDSSGGCGLRSYGAGLSDMGNASLDLGFAYGAADAGATVADMSDPTVVTASSIGPFDYAVLHADDKTEMLNWLSTNHYFVPSGTDTVLQPYIHPGAYFLALKLRSGESAGSIVPVILKYASDLPMIPLILTSVGAVPDMGIQVWLLGQHRAIPRNYRHVVIDDMPIWLRLETYESLLVRAIHEAPMKHAFVTEYAGQSLPMVGVLDPPNRFGSAATLKTLTDPANYLTYLQTHGFQFDSTLIALLQTALPEPAMWVAQGVKPIDYYLNYSSYNTSVPPDGGAGTAFDPVALTDTIEARIVAPTLATGKLFRDHPYLTRLYTALSPEDMTADPVFSENPDLPNVTPLHSATSTYPCRGAGYVRSNDTSFESQLPGQLGTSTPSALRIETLREAGPPIVDTDNRDAIVLALGLVDHGSMTSYDPAPPPAAMPEPASHGCGCAIAFTPGDRGMLLLLLGALVLVRRGIRRRLKP